MPKLISVAFAAVFALGAALPAQAQNYPNRPIKIVVPYPPGGSTDISGRIAADALMARLGQPVVVENRAGAGGLVGADAVAKAPPDGYTLLWGTSDQLSSLPAIKKTMPYRTPDDFTFIQSYATLPLAVTVKASLPIHSIADLIAYAKANPGKLRLGSSGVGSGPHLALSLFNRRAGVDIIHVPYRGIAQAMTELQGGIIDLAFVTPATVGPLMAGGKLRMLGITGPKRHPLYPDLPTLVELGYPDIVAVTFFGLLGPANLPADIVAKLHQAALDSVNDPALKEKFAPLSLVPDPIPLDAFRKLAADDFKKWSAISDTENIKLDD